MLSMAKLIKPKIKVVVPPEDSVKPVDLRRMCFHCGKKFHTEDDSFYTISYEPNRKNKLNKERVQTKFFHPECFKEIAGDDYL